MRIMLNIVKKVRARPTTWLDMIALYRRRHSADATHAPIECDTRCLVEDSQITLFSRTNAPDSLRLRDGCSVHANNMSSFAERASKAQHLLYQKQEEDCEQLTFRTMHGEGYSTLRQKEIG